VGRYSYSLLYYLIAIAYTCVTIFHNKFLAPLPGIVLFLLISIPNNSSFTLDFILLFILLFLFCALQEFTLRACESLGAVF